VAHLNLLADDGNFMTGLSDNQGRDLVLAPAPSNSANDAVDALVQVRAPGKVPTGVPEGELPNPVAGGLVPPAAADPVAAAVAPFWFAGPDGSTGVAAQPVLPVVMPTPKPKTDPTSIPESRSPAAWEELTAHVFAAEADTKDDLLTGLWSL
jgi:hypothetical protein